MKIRAATLRDCKNMAKLTVEEFAKYPYNNNQTEKETMESIKSDLKRGEGFVALDYSKLKGFIIITKEKMDKTYVFIENLVVDEKFQNQGIGKKLVEKIEKRYRKGTITLSVNKKSNAYKFYKKLGYKENKVNVNMSKSLK